MDNTNNTTIESLDTSLDDLFDNIETIPLDPNETNVLNESIEFNTSSIQPTQNHQSQGSLHLSDLNTSQVNNSNQTNQSQGSLHLSDLDVSEDSMRNNTTMESIGGKRRKKRTTKSKKKQSRIRKTKRKYTRKIKKIKLKQHGKKPVHKLKTRKIR